MRTFLDDVKDGMKGANVGLPNGLNRANKALNGVQKGHYYLVGAESGCGKTTFTDYCFVLSPYFELLNSHSNKKVKWIYYSLEISKKEKKFTWMSYLLDKFFDRQIDRNIIKGSKYPHVLSNEDFDLIKRLEPTLETMFNHVDFKDDWTNSDMIYNDLMEFAKENGTFVYDDKGMILNYIPNDKDLIVIIVIDHLALVSEMKGQNLKKAMDTVSLHLRYFRNKCGFTSVVVQQFNSEMGSIDRQKYKASALAPKREDFGDSRYTYRDADVVIGGIKPFDYDIAEYFGYPISGSKGLKDSVTFWHIIKNRYVGSRAIIPLQRGVVPKFIELPPPNRLVA